MVLFVRVYFGCFTVLVLLLLVGVVVVCFVLDFGLVVVCVYGGLFEFVVFTVLCVCVVFVL